MNAALQNVAVLLGAGAVSALAASALVLLIIPVCLLSDRRRRRREIAERLVLLAGAETAADPHPYAAGRARLDAALTDPENAP